MILEVSFSADFASWRLDFLSLGDLVSNFETRVLEVSNLPFFTPVIIQDD